MATPIVTTTEVRTASVINSDMLGSRVPFPDGLEVCDSGKLARIRELGGCAGFPVLMSDGFNTTAPSTTNGPLSINGPLTITNPSTFSITGYTTPFLSTGSVSLVWGAFQTDYATVCSGINTGQPFTITFQRIGNTKFLTFTWITTAVPSGMLFGGSGTDCMLIGPRDPGTGAYYQFPSTYLPQTTHLTTSTMLLETLPQPGTLTIDDKPYITRLRTDGKMSFIAHFTGVGYAPNTAYYPYMPPITYV